MTALRDIIICPMALVATANAFGIAQGMPSATLVAPSNPSSGPATAAATYMGCSGRLPDAVRAALDTAFASDQFPGAIWYRLNDSGPQVGQVVASFDGSQVGNKLTYAQALALNGLQPQVKPLS